MTERYRTFRDLDGHLVVETRFRVRYHETDMMGVVHHAAYITWFEEGRSAFTRALGYPYARMEAEGSGLAVVELSVRYHQPAHYDEEVIVATCLERLGSRGMTFTYQVRRAADDVLLATGSSKLLAIDGAGRVQRMPDEMRARLASLPVGDQPARGTDRATPLPQGAGSQVEDPPGLYGSSSGAFTS